ncbi:MULTISPECIES: NAD(P)H-dependent glycerol-3-phosphate dehydrogenase [Aeromonas]|uniref:Glycerol-3-phosphate dehydrogenase [NAD(P)+] n=1 Tax=Escherichia coli TaxID=562 RepID=A0A3L0VZN8_ECOLX|nr:MULTISPECIES: NAD(P)H-dependent glycerol-3-phosphate dehydrogenase [Aeromonas]MDR6996468.1 glycerol-3-phosphate dehydrogenase (NAD(P)+) [Aeromonas salmonicida]UUI60839.1 NAD(P)H-dependent glycerol-3-phosphate dehydrogenase [Aeromonas salmonicida]HEH9395800.1 NAD(P)H-dependent glycerol-3-phosphate dehydrogenase [Aeromonas salmonicida]HEH9410419.1 NAD(P)H-dependent glycerol-3-phosphate dehydrogenase [Aeromonas salmonicida]HEH9414536.1 NAD(P)H-dependent glycerol-3-phosphate dehydrogenase [Aero
MADQIAISVLGAGSYGSALAISLARNGHPTLLWGHDPAHVAELEHDRCNKAFLPDVPFPADLQLTADLQRVVQAAPVLLLVVPSHVFGQVLSQVKPFLRPDTRIAWATKGLEPDSGRLLQDVARDVLGETIPLAVISGPTFAKELAAGLPTAISVASTHDDFADELSHLLHCGRSFRVYTNPDFVGLQLGGAVKNVIAIGAGLSDGLGFGANARTALITRGLVEMQRLGAALGADAKTFMGMAGLGDLVLTCTDNQSRNRRFGLALGAGKSVDTAMAEIGQVVEGYRNTKEVHLLAARCGVEMPICEQIFQVLYQGKNPKEAAIALLSRDKRDE